jgi:hypothetical protein
VDIVMGENMKKIDLLSKSMFCDAKELMFYIK